MTRIGNAEYINFDQIIEKCKRTGINVTWRKLNYYKTLGLLPKAIRIEKDKRGYYPAFVVFVLSAYDFLQHHLGLTLDEIKKLVDRFNKKKSNNPALFYSFADWMHITYGQYLLTVLAQIQGGEGANFGAVTMGVVNYVYRAMFERSGMKAGEDAARGASDYQAIKQRAKEWAETAAKQLAAIMDQDEKK